MAEQEFTWIESEFHRSYQLSAISFQPPQAPVVQQRTITRTV
jgi:hypothetical protein